MPNFGFWNLDGNVKSHEVAAFAHERDLDVLLLAENSNRVVSLLKALNHNQERLYFSDPGNSDRITIFTRFKTSTKACLLRDGPGVSIRQYKLPIGQNFTVVAVHLSSKLWESTEGQALSATRIARYIREAENRVGHLRTLVIGDFNMNPFEHGLVGAEGFHSVMDRRVAVSGFRTFHDERRDYFYNPMWGFFGDRDKTPPGTYYYNSGGEICYYWNMFDQILLRPALIPFMDDDGIEILTELRGYSLVRENGEPDRENYSDHLPIVCRMSDF